MKKKLFVCSALIVSIGVMIYSTTSVRAYDPNMSIGGVYDYLNASVREGSSALSYQLYLVNHPPDTPVTGTVTLSTSNPDQCQISGDGINYGSTYIAALVPAGDRTNFNNWVKAVDDPTLDGLQHCVVRISMTVNDSFYSGYNSLLLDFEVYDNEDTVSAVMNRTRGVQLPEGLPPTDKSRLNYTWYQVSIYGTVPKQTTLTATTSGQCVFVNDAYTAYMGTQKSYTIGPYAGQSSGVYTFVVGPHDDTTDDPDVEECHVTTRFISGDSRWSSIILPEYIMAVADNDSPSAPAAAKIPSSSSNKATTPVTSPTASSPGEAEADSKKSSDENSRD